MCRALHFWNKVILYNLTLAVVLVSACEDIIEKDISNEVITIISPKDSLQTESSNVGFYWGEIDGATAYQLQLVTTSFEEIRSFTADTTLNSNYYETQLSTGKYQWRVKAVNNGYETDFSSIRNLEIIDSDDLSNDIVTLISPSADSYFHNGEITFRWDELPKASQYIFEILDYPEFRDTTDVSVLTKEIDLEDGEYEWRIKAVNDVSLISSVNRNINFDNTPPDFPTISINDQDSLSIDDNISWERASNDVVLDSVFISSNVEMDNSIEGYPQIFNDNTELILDESLFTIGSTYYIKIKSVDRAQNESDFTEVLSFYIE